MSERDAAIRAVRDAESRVADVAGNMESALALVQRPDRLEDALEALEWASENVRSAKHRIEAALSSVRSAVAKPTSQQGGAT